MQLQRQLMLTSIQSLKPGLHFSPSTGCYILCVHVCCVTLHIREEQSSKTAFKLEVFLKLKFDSSVATRTAAINRLFIQIFANGKYSRICQVI